MREERQRFVSGWEREILTEGGIAFLHDKKEAFDEAVVWRKGGMLSFVDSLVAHFLIRQFCRANPCWVWRSLLHLQRTSFYLWLPRGPASWREYRDEEEKEASSPHKEMGIYTNVYMNPVTYTTQADQTQQTILWKTVSTNIVWPLCHKPHAPFLPVKLWFPLQLHHVVIKHNKLKCQAALTQFDIMFTPR